MVEVEEEAIEFWTGVFSVASCNVSDCSSNNKKDVSIVLGSVQKSRSGEAGGEWGRRAQNEKE